MLAYADICWQVVRYTGQVRYFVVLDAALKEKEMGEKREGKQAGDMLLRLLIPLHICVLILHFSGGRQEGDHLEQRKLALEAATSQLRSAHVMLADCLCSLGRLSHRTGV